MQICNLFLYNENAGVLWIFVKVLNRTVFTVMIIIYVNCHLQGYLEISSCNNVVHDRSLNRLSYLYLLNAVLLPVWLTMKCEVVPVMSDMTRNVIQSVDSTAEIQLNENVFVQHHIIQKQLSALHKNKIKQQNMCK